MTSVAVIGAGVAGLTVATVLAERGAEVVVVDRSPGLGPDQCSWYAGGMLAPWCEQENAEAEIVVLGQGAADFWAVRTPGVVRRGSLVIAPARDSGELRRFARRTENYEWLDRDGIDALEPALEGRFARALFFREEAHLDPRRALAALAARLTAAGCELRYGEETAPEAEWTVDCRGLAAAADLPELRGVKGEMLYISSRDVALTRTIRLVHPRIPIYLVPRGDGIYMLGATSIENDERQRVTARSLVELLSAVYALHPAFGEAEVIETGAEARPAFPDNLPRLVRNGRRLHVNGLYRHGFLLAPAMAARAADIVLGKGAEP